MPFDPAAVTAPFRMQPGLRRMAARAGHLTPTRLDSAALAAKLAVLRSHADQALLCEPGFDAAPALQALCEQAAAEHAQSLERDGASGWRAPALGWSVHGGDVRDTASSSPGAPLQDEIGSVLRALPARWRLTALVALAFEQDFAVLDAASGRIAWTAVCLPSRWAPEDKIGRPFAEVHAPVADNTMLLAASDALVRLVTGSDRWERFVWTITANASLDEHPRRVPRTPWPADASADELAACAWWRTEHQTFIPLVERRQAVFTIHVEHRPLLAAIGSAGQARALHDALATMSAAVLAYRGLADARDRLLDWLARRAAGR